MKFFRALKKLYGYLIEENHKVTYGDMKETEIPVQESIEKETTLESTIENPYLNQVREWAVNKIDLLHEADRHKNARALEAEFKEWIHISEETEELEYLCIEDEGWTDEQEIDIQ